MNDLWSIHPLDEEYKPSTRAMCIVRGTLHDVEVWAHATIPGWRTVFFDREYKGAVLPFDVIEIGPDTADAHRKMLVRHEEMVAELRRIEAAIPEHMRPVHRL